MRRPAPADLMLLGTVGLWAFDFTAGKFALTHGLTPFSYVSLRFAGAALFLALFVWRSEGTLRTSRRDLVALVAAGLVGVFLNQVGYINGLKLTTATTAALVYGTLPVVTAVVAFAARLERTSRRFWAASALSFGGVALVAGGSGGELSGDLGGVLLILVAVGTWAVYSVIATRLMRRSSPYRFTAVATLIGCVPLLAVGGIDLAGQDWSLRPLVWAAVAYGCLGSQVLAVLLWFGAVQRVGPSRATLYANLQPFAGALIALLVLSEQVTALQWVGGATIAASIVLARRGAARVLRREP